MESQTKLDNQYQVLQELLSNLPLGFHLADSKTTMTHFRQKHHHLERLFRIHQQKVIVEMLRNLVELQSLLVFELSQ